MVPIFSVVLLRSGPHAGKTAVIAEIIDHNRVSDRPILAYGPFLNFPQAIVDGPATGVPRHAFPYRHLTLTPFRLSKLPRGAGSGVVLKQLTSEGIVEKWNKSTWATKRAAVEKRKSLNDFERFKTMVGKKTRRDVVRKSVKAAKKA